MNYPKFFMRSGICFFVTAVTLSIAGSFIGRPIYPTFWVRLVSDLEDVSLLAAGISAGALLGFFTRDTLGEPDKPETEELAEPAA